MCYTYYNKYYLILFLNYNDLKFVYSIFKIIKNSLIMIISGTLVFDYK